MRAGTIESIGAGLALGTAILAGVWLASRKVAASIDEGFSFGDLPSLHPELTGELVGDRRIRGGEGDLAAADRSGHARTHGGEGI